MAQSRLERIGTIYSRTKGLMESGAVKWVDRPLWYDLYEAFPPKEEPMYGRPTPKLPLRQIFYEEDKVRAQFHKNNKNIGAVNLQNRRTKSLTQRLIDNYKKLEAQYEGGASHEHIYDEAVEMLKKERERKKEGDDKVISLSAAFKEAESASVEKQNVGVNVKDIFKE